jgi:CheY-like chemotaxis protein
MKRTSPLKIQNIFLADDDSEDRQLFTEALHELPFEINVATFDNGVTLMDELLNHEKKLPDLIFLDLNMPLMNGEECLADIRDEPKLAKIPIIIYSNYLDKEKVKLLYRKGADRYLKKPTQFAKLKSSLSYCIKSLESVKDGKGSLVDFIIKD